MKDIRDGTVPDSMDPSEVYGMRPEYRQYPYERFEPNLNNLRNALNRDQGKADSDSAALAHDRRIHPKSTETAQGCGYPRWDGSEAERLLMADMDAGKHKRMRPEELYRTQEEYQRFPQQVFRDHIHQEQRARTEKPYWKRVHEERGRR